jgi:hypothetical protein
MGKYAKYLKEIQLGQKYVKSAGAEVMRFQGMIRPIEYDQDDEPKCTLHFECFIWYGPGMFIGDGSSMEGKGPRGEKMTVRFLPHRHPAEEVFIFMSTDTNNPTDLGGEHEFWIGEGDEAEKLLITKNSVLFVPGGVVHNPNGCLRADRPYSMFVALKAPLHIDEHVEVPQAFLDEHGGAPPSS